MARHAGFAFVVCISEPFVNSSLRAVHANFLPPVSASLPSPVNVGGTPVTISASLVLLPPQVSLAARPDDRIEVTIGFAGQVVMSAGTAAVQTEVVLSATVLVNFFSSVAPVLDREQITVGLDLKGASITSVNVRVLNGPALSTVFSAALSSGPVLDALNAALHAIPPSFAMITPAGLNLKSTIAPTYQPPGGSLFDPDALFSATFALARIVVRPINAAVPGPGALAVGVDMSLPQATNGDPAALIDLNTVAGPRGNVVEYNGYAASTFSGVPASADKSDSSLFVNGDWLSAVVNNVISPQLAGKFPTSLAKDNVGFSNEADCVSLAFGSFQVPLDCPSSPPIPTGIMLNGMKMHVKLSRYANIAKDVNGYYHGSWGVDADVYTQCTAVLQSIAAQPPTLPRPPAGAGLTSVTFSTNPEGGYVYVDGATIATGKGPWAKRAINLPPGTHTIGANPLTYQSWSVPGSDPKQVHGANPAQLIVKGPMNVVLDESQYDPFLTRDTWVLAVLGTTISLPWWVDAVAVVEAIGLILGPIYLAGATLASVFGSIALSGAIDNVEASAQSSLQGALPGLLPDKILYNYGLTITQFPKTSAPDWLITATDLAFSNEGMEGHVRTTLLPPGLALGSTGNFPYLMVTNQDVSDPGAIPDIPDPSGDFPRRIDGTFVWPGVNYNSGATTGSVTWDVHDLQPIGVVLKVPAGLFNPQDPGVYVEWNVKRNDTGAVILSKILGLGQAGAPANILTVAIDHSSAALQSVGGFSVDCSVFRPLAAGSDVIFHASVDIAVLDHFDRTHPYVQWGSHVKYVYPGVPFWNAIPPLAHDPAKGYGKIARVSRIHRTDFWNGGQRCMVADTAGSAGKLPHKPRGAYNYAKFARTRLLSYPWQYLDSLPVSLDTVRRNRDAARGILCDYCFFGGPGRTTLRTDFPK